MTTTSIVCSFPPGYFLENLTTFGNNNGLFITCANRQELYHVLPSAHGPVSPTLVHTFAPDQWAMGITTIPQHPNTLFVVTSDLLGQGSRKSYLHLIDTANPAAGSRPRELLKFPDDAKALNGLCALSDKVLLVADSFASCIWRIDLDLSTYPPQRAAARVWHADATMAAELKLPDFQPGTNGLKYSAVTGCVYYTSTQQRLFCEIGVDPGTLNAKGEARVLARGMQGDDLVIDDRSSEHACAYVTTHRDNTILKIALGHSADDDPTRESSDAEVVVDGNATGSVIMGPTAGTWVVERKGQSAYFTTDGGLKNPPSDGWVQCARVVRVDFGPEIR